MKISNTVKDMLFAVTHPSFLIQQNKYSPVVDEFVDHLIERNVAIDSHDNYTVTIGDIEIWTSNYPYAYGRIHHVTDSVTNVPKGRPSRRNIWRLKMYVDSHIATKDRDILSMESVFMSKMLK